MLVNQWLGRVGGSRGEGAGCLLPSVPSVGGALLPSVTCWEVGLHVYSLTGFWLVSCGARPHDRALLALPTWLPGRGEQRPLLPPAPFFLGRSLRSCPHPCSPGRCVVGAMDHGTEGGRVKVARAQHTSARRSAAEREPRAACSWGHRPRDPGHWPAGPSRGAGAPGLPRTAWLW